MAVWRFNQGADQLSGQPGEHNLYFACPTELNPQDTVFGTNSSLFFDILILTCPGPVTAAQLAGLTGFEMIQYHPSGNSVALSNQFVADTSWGIFAVLGGGGNDTADSSGVTNHTRIAFYAGDGVDTFIGGNGNDYAEFAAASLTAADLINGGAGFDFLAISTGGPVSAAALANITGIEDVLLSNFGNSITLSNEFLAGASNGVMTIQDGAGNDTVDASNITNATRVAFYTSSGNETFIGGNGNDYLAFAAGSLTASDHIEGGANFDVIEFVTAGTVSAGAFDNVSGIDLVMLSDGGNTVTLTSGVAASTDNGVLVVLDGAGNDSVDAGAVVNNRVVFQSTAGNDSFTGGGNSDVALFDAASLTASDVFAGGTGFDILQLTSAGVVNAAAFMNFSGVDELFLTLGGNSIALSGALVANSDNGVFVVCDQAGHNVVDASAATLGGRVVFNAVAGDHNTYTGGTGSDFFQFGDASLNSTDTLAGGNGAGTDFLVVTNAASVTAADVINVTQMEVVQLAAGGAIALPDGLSNSGSLEADGTNAADTIDGAAVTSYGIVFKGNGGSDTLIGGGGSDQFFVPDTNFVGIDGNAGFDTMVLTAAFDGQTFDLTSQVSRITDVEAISLESAAGAIVNVAPGDIAQINASTNYLYLAGGSDDEVNVSGNGWTQLETNHTNANLPGHTFVHYHNVNGSDLYIDSLIGFPIAL